MNVFIVCKNCIKIIITAKVVQKLNINESQLNDISLIIGHKLNEKLIVRLR
jgi:hypothetical protein